MARSEFIPPPGRRADGTTYDPAPADVEATAAAVVDAAFKVHSVLGPGLLEKVYEACLCRELTLRGIPFKTAGIGTRGI